MRKLFLGLLLSGLMSAHAADVRLISVTGVAEKSMQPDIVRIMINTWGKGDSAKKAQSASAAQGEILKKSMEAFKIKKEDVRTTSYNLNPEYVYDQKTNKNNIVGFMAAQDMVVTLKKVDDAGAFIDSLTTASKSTTSGINVNSLSFDIDKRTEEENALLGDAVRAAEAQAEILAKAAKVKLKGIYRLAPRGNSSPVPMYQADALRAAPRAKSAETTIMAGEVKVEGAVSADYVVE